MKYSLIDSESISDVEYKKLSPLSSVPTLKIGNDIIIESVAMIELIEELYPLPTLLSKSPIQRAHVRELVEMVNGFLHPGQTSFVPRFFHPNIDDHEVKNYRKKWLTEGLPDLLKKAYLTSSFAVGDSFTAADLTILPLYAKALELGVNPAEFKPLKDAVIFIKQQKQLWETCPEDLKNTFNKFYP